MKQIKFAKVYLCIIIFVILTLIYGTIHADATRIVRYDIYVNKSMGNIKELNVAMVSDIHIGRTIGKRKVERMISTINSMKPDVILIAGDMVDYEAQTYISEGMTQAFRKLKATYGTYGVLGNHEYISGEPEKLQRLYEESGIYMLKDSLKDVNNSFYIVGRDDASAEKLLGTKRKPLSQVLKGVNPDKLILMMDHQPVDYSEAEKSGVDLMVSGHTHKGQFFPGNIFTHIMYRIDWGCLKENNFNAIVSSGFGTWGPPIRIGTNSEIVKIVIHFRGA
jgi:predicted MPP superfamily phosphohydrolase